MTLKRTGADNEPTAPGTWDKADTHTKPPPPFMTSGKKVVILDFHDDSLVMSVYRITLVCESRMC